MQQTSEDLRGEGSGELVVRNTASGVALPPNVAARNDALEKFLREKGARSRHTPARYRRDLSVFFEWVDRKGYDVATLMPWQMGEYAADLKDGHLGELKASTRAGRINAVSSFYRFLQQQAREVIPQNPAERTPRPEVGKRSVTRKLSAEELTRLRDIARPNPRLYALVQLLAGSGVRISEALGADVHHLKREGAEWYLYVVRKGSEDRVPVQVPVEAARAVRRYVRDRRGPIFVDRAGRRWNRTAAARSLQYAALRAGITDRNVSPHSLRHTATTLALDAGVPIRDVQVQMGHTSTETTARYDRDNRERNNPTVAALGAIIADDLADEEEQG
ncbi:tyrosine-type recombinase/integrase [Pseudonocardia sp. NPDC049154]|uniref:tyrosine-type recombinase/integrase n=1 Tax=Pseudonocardia sp. NPDC049154 TaxID=3155501 RepID=UPI0033F21C99